jgi:predicted RNA-binding Zn-ribbon protein involved in translation (DUF1610 family)
MENTDKHNNKYKNSKIYQITDLAYTECYIGSTTQQLSCRMSGHRRKYRHVRNKTAYSLECSIFELFDKYGVENCKIELIEDYPCETKEQLLKREGYHIQTTCCVNRRIAGRTNTEYRNEHRYIKRVLDKIYRDTHKEQVLKWKRTPFTCPTCGSCIMKAEKARHERSKKHQEALETKTEPEI